MCFKRALIWCIAESKWAFELFESGGSLLAGRIVLLLYQLGVNPPADIASGRIAEVRSRSMSCNCTRSIFSGSRPVLIYGKRNGMPRKRPADGSGSDPGSRKTGRKSSGNCKPKNQSDGDGSYQCDSFYIRHKLEHYPRDRQARRNRSHI